MDRLFLITKERTAVYYTFYNGKYARASVFFNDSLKKFALFSNQIKIFLISLRVIT